MLQSPAISQALDEDVASHKHLPLRNIPKIKAKECNKSWDFILVVPDPPSYAMEGGHWRDATSIRLAVPLPYLALGPPACCCHDRFGQTNAVEAF